MSGWICPKCGRVFAPSCQQCLFCNANQVRCDDCKNPVEAGEVLEKRTILGMTYHVCAKCREGVKQNIKCDYCNKNCGSAYHTIEIRTDGNHRRMCVECWIKKERD